jgi:hypothetical protein
MRIQSIYKDYYDSGLSYGIDKDIFYYRKLHNLKYFYDSWEIDVLKKTLNSEDYEKLEIFRDTIDKTIKNPVRRSHYSEITIANNISFFISFNTLFLSGEVINFARISEIKTIQDITKKTVLLNEEFIYDINILDTRYKEIYKLKKDKKYYYLRDIKKSFQEYIDNIDKIKDKYNFIFRLYDTPCFLLRNYTGDNTDIEISNSKEEILPGIIINPVLKNIKLKNIINPYECFQKISMYMNYLHNPEEEVKVAEMDDKTKRDAHGFNDCSFKSCSSKNKKKK